MKSFAFLLVLAAARAADTDWPAYLGDKGSSHYSSLAQITRENVSKL